MGSTLRDLPDDKNSENAVSLVTNFESQLSAGEFAEMYKKDGLQGGHVIMLGADPASHAAALEALKAYPGKLIRSWPCRHLLRTSQIMTLLWTIRVSSFQSWLIRASIYCKWTRLYLHYHILYRWMSDGGC